MNYVQTIQDLQNKVQKNKEELIRLEEKSKNLKEEKEKIVIKLKEANVEESNLDKKIVTLEEDLKSEITKIEESLK